MKLKDIYNEIREETEQLVCNTQFVDKFGKFHKKGDKITRSYYETLDDNGKAKFTDQSETSSYKDRRRRRRFF
jgi:hypothetical protein